MRKLHPKVYSGKCIFCNKEVVFLKDKHGKDIRVDPEYSLHKENIVKHFVVEENDVRFDSLRHHLHRCNQIDLMVYSLGITPETAAEIIQKKKEEVELRKQLIEARFAELEKEEADA